MLHRGFVAVALVLARAAHAHIVLPAHLASGAVLQTWRGYHTATQLFGTASPGELVSVACSVPGVPVYTALADATTGAWDLAYNWPPGPTDWNDFDLTFTGSQTPAPLVLSGVRWGDVVLCVGDGAALLPVAQAVNGTAWAASKNVAAALESIRLFPTAVNGACAWTPDAPGAAPCNAWTNASVANVAGFSAACLQTAVEATLAPGFGGNRVVGIIQLAANDSHVEDWVPAGAEAALAHCPALPGGPATPGTKWDPMFQTLPVRYFIVAVGASDAGRLRNLSAAGYDAWACRLQVLVAGLRSGPQIGAPPVVLLEPAAVDESLFALRLGAAMLLPPQPPPFRTCALALGVAEPGADEYNTLPTAQHAAASLVYTAWWAFTTAALGPVAQSVAVSNDTVAFFFFPGAVANASTLKLVPVAGCARCCASDSAAFQVSYAPDAAADSWVNATGVVSPDGTQLVVLAGKAFLWARYGAAPALASECILTDAKSGLPAPAFLVAFSSLSAAASPEKENEVLAASAVLPTHPAWDDYATTPLPADSLEARRDHLLRGAQRAQAWARGERRYAGLAATPPMYFNTWQAFRCNLNQDLLVQTGAILVASGLAAAGFTSVNMDDCEWRSARDNATGAVVPDDSRFPSGLPHVVAALANLSVPLTLGVYTSQTSETCTGRPGSYEHEDVDAATYCAWGAAFVKVDRCGGTAYKALNTSWINLRTGLDTHCTARPAVLSVESCGVSSGGSGVSPTCAQWIRSTGAQMWRTTADLQLYWTSVLFNFDNNEPMAPLAGPGGWNDPDMLIVGHPGLTAAEQQSHVAAWAISAAPLGLSLDVVNGALTSDVLALLLAPEVLAVDQDPAGVQGVRVTPANGTGTECWARPLSATGAGHLAVVAVFLFNRASTAETVTCAWASVAPHFPPGTAATVRDLWARRDLGNFTGSFTTAAPLPPHGSMLVKLTPL